MVVTLGQQYNIGEKPTSCNWALSLTPYLIFLHKMFYSSNTVTCQQIFFPPLCIDFLTWYFLYAALFCYSVHTFVPASPDQGHDRPCRRDVGRVFLAGVRPDSPSRREKDSFLLPPRPWPWCGGGVGSARCSLGTHPPCESSTCQRFKRRHVRRFGACAEADDNVVESWCVLSAPGV